MQKISHLILSVNNEGLEFMNIHKILNLIHKTSIQSCDMSFLQPFSLVVSCMYVCMYVRACVRAYVRTYMYVCIADAFRHV